MPRAANQSTVRRTFSLGTGRAILATILPAILAAVGFFLLFSLCRPISTSASVAAAASANVNSPALQISEAPSITLAVYRWEPITMPSGIRNLAVHPNDAYTAYAATSDGLWRTQDGGLSWTRLATDTVHYVYQVSVSDGDPNRLYAILWNKTVGSSSDGGATWAVHNSPSLCQLVPSPVDPLRVYATPCTSQPGPKPAMYRSDDGGVTWYAPTDAITDPFSSLVASSADVDALVATSYSRVFRSADGGSNWERVTVAGSHVWRVVGDVHSPQVIYGVNSSGVLRSADDGRTWRIAYVGLPDVEVVPFPLDPSQVLVAAGDGHRLKDEGSGWHMDPWQFPGELGNFWYASHDDQILYVTEGVKAWRYMLGVDTWPNGIFMSLIRATSPTPARTPEQVALERANEFREKVGAAPLVLHPAIVDATRNSVNYYILNADDPSAWANGPHGEVEGKPGFTGVWPSDRMIAAGYPYVACSEIKHYLGEPIRSVDGWVDTVYHRLPVIDPVYLHTGYAMASVGSRRVDVMNFGRGPNASGYWYPAEPFPLAYPADQQSEVPPQWNGHEWPDPLPPGAKKPVGYPFTLQGVNGTLQVTAGEMRDVNGNVVPTHPNPSACADFGCYTLIPVKPLRAYSRYTVAVRGAVGGVAFDRQWTFTTGANVVNSADGEGDVIIGPPWLELDPRWAAGEEIVPE